MRQFEKVVVRLPTGWWHAMAFAQRFVALLRWGETSSGSGLFSDITT